MVRLKIRISLLTKLLLRRAQAAAAVVHEVAHAVARRLICVPPVIVVGARQVQHTRLLLLERHRLHGLDRRHLVVAQRGAEHARPWSLL